MLKQRRLWVNSSTFMSLQLNASYQSFSPASSDLLDVFVYSELFNLVSDETSYLWFICRDKTLSHFLVLWISVRLLDLSLNIWDLFCNYVSVTCKATWLPADALIVMWICCVHRRDASRLVSVQILHSNRSWSQILPKQSSLY